MTINFNSLDKELNEASEQISLSKNNIKSPPPKRIFHYTNTAGLMGILSSSRIWATHFRYLNDSSEISYGFSLFERIVGKKIESNKNEIINAFLKRTLITANPFDGMFECYVACFCENDDLLNQWRSYTDSGGGFSVAFDAEMIDLRIRVEDPSQDFILRKVVYDPEIQYRLIEEVVDKAIAVLLQKTDGLTVDDANSAIARCCHFVRCEVAEYLITFKHPAFETENEWRILHIIGCHEEVNLKFRDGPYGITPYVCLDPCPMIGANSHRLPIVAVRHGPTSNAQNIKYSLNKILRQNGYAFIEISGTELPMRTNI